MQQLKAYRRSFNSRQWHYWYYYGA